MRLHLEIDVQLDPIFDDPDLTLAEHIAGMRENYPSLTALVADTCEDAEGIASVRLSRSSLGGGSERHSADWWPVNDDIRCPEAAAGWIARALAAEAALNDPALHARCEHIICKWEGRAEAAEDWSPRT